MEDCGSTRKKRDVQYSITKEAKCDLSYDNASDNSSQSDEIGYNKIGATSGASKPSSWIDAVKGVFQFISSPLRAALPSFSENSSSRSGTAGSSSNHSDTVRNPNIQYTSQFSREVCASNNASLMFFLLQAFLDKKCPLPKFSDVNPVKALFYTSDIIKSFKEVLEKQAESKGGIKMHRLDINFEKLFEKINEKIRSGEFNEISGILKSYAEEALPGREPGDPGRLSPKKFDKFMAEFNRRIDPVINQLMQQMLSRLEVSDVKEQQISLEPKSYLNNTSVQCHLTQARGQGKVLIP
ncbi:hypothetical protein wCauA_03900 [Wolbachia endosymbiont of Carposina sasakii]|nr:hypothetical protein [Wolbachia pipientis]MBA8753781.1 hypothetical protein [Wolbachia pipientis]NGZ19707.1 hypothetical protein [Wolbachia pipientis]QDH19325.1 hypothetical protein wCauA_03900 [Wolbachia endosymbiont of Carposina sasakii]QTG99506.1 hypothetical protein J5252_00950 [Wolbachia pipientis]